MQSARKIIVTEPDKTNERIGIFFSDARQILSEANITVNHYVYHINNKIRQNVTTLKNSLELGKLLPFTSIHKVIH